jgi:hypothetical protein
MSLKLIKHTRSGIRQLGGIILLTTLKKVLFKITNILTYTFTQHRFLAFSFMKYVIVTGGVVSGLGKGITISSIGRILKSSGVRVTSIKIDPYMNVDAGTMSPFEHGETFVLNDGGETDLDLGVALFNVYVCDVNCN